MFLQVTMQGESSTRAHIQEGFVTSHTVNNNEGPRILYNHVLKNGLKMEVLGEETSFMFQFYCTIHVAQWYNVILTSSGDACVVLFGAGSQAASLLQAVMRQGVQRASTDLGLSLCPSPWLAAWLQLHEFGCLH